MYSKALHTVGLAIDGTEKWRLLEDGTLYRLSDGAEAGVIFTRTTIITAAQLADLHNTAIELVPAPGANKLVWVQPQPIAVSQNLTIGASNPALIHLTINNTEVFVDSSGSTDGFAGNILLSGDDQFCTGGTISTYDYGANVQQYTDLSNMLNAPVMLVAAENLDVKGAIVTSAIGAAGTGYSAEDVVTRGDASITIDTVGGSGEVLTYTVTDAGTNNIIGNGQATTGGGGSGFTISITELDYSVNPMELKVKVLYSIFDLS